MGCRRHKAVSCKATSLHCLGRNLVEGSAGLELGVHQSPEGKEVRMRPLPPTHTLCKASACFCGRTGQTRRLQNVWKSRKRGGTIPESFLVRSRPLLTLPGHTLCIGHLVMPPPSRMDSAPVHDTTLADCPVPPDTDKPQPTRATSGDTATVPQGQSVMQMLPFRPEDA